MPKYCRIITEVAEVLPKFENGSSRNLTQYFVENLKMKK
jgi:hypothetical protein